MGMRNQYLLDQFEAVKGHLHVLIVDDEQDNRDLTEMVLHSFGLDHTQTAANGAEALDLMHRDKINVVLTDLTMPVMNGMELVRQIRARDAFHTVPIIMISGDKERQVEARQNGVNDFLIKPFDIRDLRIAIAQATLPAGARAPA